MALPADSHVHSEWSWDTGGPRSAAAGTMMATCRRAIEIGLPALIFTEHLDFDGWRVAAGDPVEPHEWDLVDEDGILRPPALDVDGYLESIERCRHAFPQLRILTGVEYGQPHLFDARAAELLDLSALDRVNGSLHTVQNGTERSEPFTLFGQWPAERVIGDYLAEVVRMINGSDSFAVLCHLDYAVRSWPTEQLGPFDPRRFEEEFRTALRALAESERALEINTRQLAWWLPQWWAEEGGRAVTFGSDAHVPGPLAAHFGEATAMLAHFGFRPGRRAEDFWIRS